MPLTRVVDLVALVAVALRERDADAVEFPAGFFENQDEPLRLPRLDGARSRDGLCPCARGGRRAASSAW